MSRVWAEPGGPRRSQPLSRDSSLAEFNISPHRLNTESGPHAKCFTRLLSFPITALSMRERGDRSSGQFRGSVPSYPLSLSWNQDSLYPEELQST